MVVLEFDFVKSLSANHTGHRRCILLRFLVYCDERNKLMKPTPPLLSGAPILGHALEFQKDRQALFQRGLETIGPVFSIRLANKPAAVVIGPEYHQTFFLETDKKLSMNKTYQFLTAMFGPVAFAASPEVYNEQRPIIHSPFKHEKMVNYIKVMQLEIQQWLDTLGQQGEFELTAAMNALVQNVAAHALMGRAFREQMGREFWDLYLVLGASLDPLLPPNLPLPKFMRRDKAKASLRNMLKPILAERRLHPENYDDFLQDFVNARYKDGRPVEDETIISLILALMFAGHETTSGQASWTIIQLLQNPDYLALVKQELAECLPYCAPIDARTLANLPQVAWAVDETTRMHPSADILIRLAEEDIEVGDYRIPKGWVVFVTAGTAHRLPEWFAGPNGYDPLRFAPGREEDRQHRFAMIGFGGGVHKCAGMNFANTEMMMITALLFQQFELELVTVDPGINYGLGASRPEKTVIKYRRSGNQRLGT
jgi:sterol 14-demethylase